MLYYAPDTLCHRQQYIDDFTTMSKALAECQREDGFWSVSLAAPTNYGSPESEGPETSGTALFVAGMAYGVHTGLLDSATYMPHIRSGWTALCLRAVDENGALHYVQGTGSKPEDAQPIVYTTKPDFEDFGVGCFLLAAAEVYQLGDVDIETDDKGDSGESSGDSGDSEEGSGDSEESSTGSLNAEKQIVGTEIYSASGIVLPEPVQGINIVKTLYSDGSIDVKKIFIK